MPVVAAIGFAGSLFVLIVVVSIAVLRSERRLECARLRDELVDAARLGGLDVSQPRVFGLIDWFDRVAATGRMIAIGRHTGHRPESSRLTASLMDALSPTPRQFAPVGPTFPHGTEWPQTTVQAAPLTDVENRAICYQREKLRQRRQPRSTGFEAADRPASGRRTSPRKPSGRRVAAQRPVDEPAQRDRGTSDPRGEPDVPPSLELAREPRTRSPQPALTPSLIDLSPRHQRRGSPKPTFIRTAHLLPEPLANGTGRRARPDPIRIDPIRPDPIRAEPIRAELSRKEARRKPLSREEAVVVTGRGKPRGALMPVTGPIAQPSPHAATDSQPVTLAEQIFALPVK